MFRLIFMVIVLTACGAAEPPVNERSPQTGPHIENSILNGLVMEFLGQATEHGISHGHYTELSTIDFSNEMRPNVLGTCYTSGRTRWIELLGSLTGNRLRTTLWHELGHCVYDMDHTTDNGQIMSAAVYGTEYESALTEFWESVPEQYHIGE